MIRNRLFISTIFLKLMLLSALRCVSAENCWPNKTPQTQKQAEELPIAGLRLAVASSVPARMTLHAIFSWYKTQAAPNHPFQMHGSASMGTSKRVEPTPVPKGALRLIHADDTARIVEIAYSSDKKHVLMLQRRDKLLYLLKWNSQTARLTGSIKLSMVVNPIELTQPVRMAVSSQGVIAFAAAHRFVGDGQRRRQITVSIVDENSGQELRRFKHGPRGFVDCLAFQFSSSGKWLASANVIYDTKTWKPIKLLDQSRWGLYRSISFHPILDQVIIVYKAKLAVFDLATGDRCDREIVDRETARLVLENKNRYVAAAWLPQRDAIVVGGTGQFVIASKTRGEDRGPWHLHYHPAFSQIKVSASGRWVAAIVRRTFQNNKSHVVIYNTQTCQLQCYPAMKFDFHPIEDRLVVLQTKRMKHGRIVWCAKEINLVNSNQGN